MSITPMFGSYLFMPVLHHERRLGTIANKSFDSIRNAYIVKREYDSVLNAFTTNADRNTARDYNDEMDRLVFANKRNAVYFAIDQSQAPYGDQVDRQAAIFKSHTNAFFEYQVFMAQQLQYFTVHGCKFIFDPVIRKQIFDIATNIYRGSALFRSEPQYISYYTWRPAQDLVALKALCTVAAI